MESDAPMLEWSFATVGTFCEIRNKFEKSEQLANELVSQPFLGSALKTDPGRPDLERPDPDGYKSRTTIANSRSERKIQTANQNGEEAKLRRDGVD